MTIFPKDNMSRTPEGERVFAYLNAGVFHSDLCDAVKEKFNCHEVEITDAGEIWIANPQTGHWLSADHVTEFCDWLDSQ